MKYIALLRGINVGGNNKVVMSDLKLCFVSIGFKNVQTYINSGNVIFETQKKEKAKLVEVCEKAIENDFGFRVVCCVVAASELESTLDKAPSWWGKDNEYKHNAVFVIAPKTVKEVMISIGDYKPGYENVKAVQTIIFWSAKIKTFSRTRYSKIAGNSAYQSVTIRNFNTTKKLAELCG